jgi:hypothetical protein
MNPKAVAEVEIGCVMEGRRGGGRGEERLLLLRSFISKPTMVPKLEAERAREVAEVAAGSVGAGDAGRAAEGRTRS